MKYHMWLRYGNRGETIEIIVRDVSDAKIESWKIATEDKKSAAHVFQILKEKYGIDLFMYEPKKDKDRDLDWLK